MCKLCGKYIIGKDEEKYFKKDCTFLECSNCFGLISRDNVKYNTLIKCFHHHLP
jgi:hypothetical protein